MNEEKLDERRWRQRKNKTEKEWESEFIPMFLRESYILVFILLFVSLCFGRHNIIYTNVIFIRISIISLGLPVSPPALSVLGWAVFSMALQFPFYRQLFTQSARKLALNTAIRWHTESRNRSNQSNTDAISNFIAPSLSFSLTFSFSPFISPLICSSPHDHNPSPRIGTQRMMEEGLAEEESDSLTGWNICSINHK